MFVATPPVMGHIKSGKLRALAVTGANRIAALGDLPTMREAGYPDFVVRDWQGFVVRAGAPGEVVTRLNTAIAIALASDEVKATFAKLGADPAAGPAESFGKLIEDDVARWAKLAKAAKIRELFGWPTPQHRVVAAAADRRVLVARPTLPQSGSTEAQG